MFLLVSVSRVLELQAWASMTLSRMHIPCQKQSTDLSRSNIYPRKPCSYSGRNDMTFKEKSVRNYILGACRSLGNLTLCWPLRHHWSESTGHAWPLIHVFSPTHKGPLWWVERTYMSGGSHVTWHQRDKTNSVQKEERSMCWLENNKLLLRFHEGGGSRGKEWGADRERR